MKTIDELQAEIAGLKAILQDKDKEIETLEKVKKEKSEQIAKLKKLNDWYMEQLKLKAKEKFGKSSEKAIDGQLSLFDVFNEAETFREPIQSEPPQESIISEHKRRKAKRGSKFNDIPVEVVEYKLDESEQVCDNCHSPLTVMKKEIRKEPVVVPAEVKVIEHVTYVYSCRNCDKNGESGFIKIAPHPKALIKKSVVSPSFMSYIMNQKYTLALPLYRMEQEFKRLGFEISRQNLSNWIIKGANLLKPIYEQIKFSLLNETLLHADETVLEVLHEPGKEASHMCGCIEQANTIHILQYCMNIHLVEVETMLKSFLRIGKELTFTAMGTPDIKSLWIRHYADALYMQRECSMSHTKLIGAMSMQNKERLI